MAVTITEEIAENGANTTGKERSSLGAVSANSTTTTKTSSVRDNTRISNIGETKAPQATTTMTIMIMTLRTLIATVAVNLITTQTLIALLMTVREGTKNSIVDADHL